MTTIAECTSADKESKAAMHEAAISSISLLHGLCLQLATFGILNTVYARLILTIKLYKIHHTTAAMNTCFGIINPH